MVGSARGNYEHTRVFSLLSEDDATDTALMSKLLSAGTGIETNEQELEEDKIKSR